jgi:hypothetical protein
LRDHLVRSSHSEHRLGQQATVCSDFYLAWTRNIELLHETEEAHVKKELALKIVLTIVGLIFVALAMPMVMFMRQEPALAMMLSLYVTLGVFLLLAIRNPSQNRSLISFTAWSSLVHAVVMGGQALHDIVARGELIGVAVLALIGVVLIALAPEKQSSTL